MPSSKIFSFLFGIIILIALLERVIPALGDNFYFTVDQGSDAVHVREILERKQTLLKGPETDISGFYAGPLWYYFIATGYKLFDGNPFGALFMVILINIIALAIITLIIARRTSKLWGILIGFSLLIFWPFFDTARFAFNPFVLVLLSFITLILLAEFKSGNKNKFFWAAIPVGLGFHTEVAGSMALLILYLLIGYWDFMKKRITLQALLTGGFIIALFFTSHAINELGSGFSQTHSLLREFKLSDGAFSGNSFIEVSKYIFTLITQSAFNQNKLIGFFLFTLIIFIFLGKLRSKKKINDFALNFSSLTAIITAIALVFFGSNNGWRDWQTAYLYPLVFVSLLLLLSQLKIKYALALFVLIFISQGIFFSQRYSQLFTGSDDQSVLVNELSAIDWVYQQSNGQGFNVYSYVPPAIDFPYQYLFWWYGLKKYGYVPCDYSSFPGSPKPLYIPGSMYYENPKKECTNSRFLIIETGKDLKTRENWLQEVRKDTTFVSETSIGKIQIEKRIFNDQETK